MALDWVTDLDDPRLEPYRNLRQTNHTRDKQWVIAEGNWVVQRLLASRFTVESVLLSERRIDGFRQYLHKDTNVLVVQDVLIREIIGFKFHSGVIACGHRPTNWQQPLVLDTDSHELIVCCPYITLPDNLGSIVRLSAGLGATSLLLGARCADPFSRRVVRVSMGNIFFFPVRVIETLHAHIAQLRQHHGFRIIAATLQAPCIPLKSSHRASRMVLLLGNEAHGLDEEWYELADERVTIPMVEPIDSLNVADAAAIMLYHYCQG
ncbi:MAG TPA: RNA methyltransferase [Pirellulaceae bacterium]|nr:RNA methyltransferase [Pirellulaceae bacterium]HMO93546.1 RNA methyltransferase [Pirellulaceae bacterium]HMP70342.1 RNA methyltransferase [Pirellulaceae bacterium]